MRIVTGYEVLYDSIFLRETLMVSNSKLFYLIFNPTAARRSRAESGVQQVSYLTGSLHYMS